MLPFRAHKPLFIPAGGIQFVGMASAKDIITNKTLSLTALTGGIASAPAANDVVVGYSTLAGGTDRNPGISTTGYTMFADIFANDTHDSMLFGAVKAMGGSPDTSIDFTVGATESVGAMVVSAWVFRGVDTANPLDTLVEAVSARNRGQTNTADPDPLDLTPTTTGAVMLIAMMSSHIAGAVNLTGAGYLGNSLIDNRVGSSRSCSVAIGTVDWTGGTYNPAAATLTGGDATCSAASSCIALRPA